MHVRTLHGSCFEEALRIRGLKEKTRMVLLGLTETLASIVADRTVAISPQTLRWTPWVRTVIPNGVDTAFFAPHGDTDRRRTPTVLFVGTWAGRKRGEDLARSFAERVRARVPEAELRMVTQDAPRDLPDGVTALGRLSDAALADEYRRAWVFCLPSSYEGFGIPYAEAMAAGLPVVATRNVGAEYVTDDGRYGILAELDDIDVPIVRLLRDPDERDRWRTLALKRAAEFDLQLVADRYERVYRTPKPSHSRRARVQAGRTRRG
jgi:glycosyltransferase involved in cell wall biosynthesis